MTTLDIVQTFNYNDRSVRTAGTPDHPLFVAKDVCEILDIGNVTDALARLDGDEFDSIEVTDSIGRKQLTKAVTESGLYSLILGSRKPEARQFKRWITHEVLPAIRKTGQYSVQKTPVEMLLESARLLVEQERRQLALEARVEEVEARQTQSTEGPCEYYSVVAFCKLHKIRCDIQLAAKIGRKASAISSALGASTGSVPDSRFVRVKTYHIEVLETACSELGLLEPSDA
jgi:prophage antirepressor-like protein